MPKYKNLSSKTEVIHSITFNPLDEKEVNFYIDTVNQYPEFKMTSEEPIPNLVSYSELVNNGSFNVLENLKPGVNVIRITSANSSAFISLNSSSSPKIQVLNTESLYLRNPYKIKEIFVEGSVFIELWNEFNFRN